MVLVERETTEKWNRIESPEIDSLKHSQPIFDKGSKAIQCGKDSLSTNGAGNAGHSCTKQTYLDTELTRLATSNRKWTTDLNVKCITIEVLAGDTVKNLGDLHNHSDL